MKKRKPLDPDGPCRCGSKKKYADCCAQDDAHKALALRLNEPIIGDIHGSRRADGSLLWAALRASDGKSLPVLPEEPFTNPPVIRSTEELDEAAARLKRSTRKKKRKK